MIQKEIIRKLQLEIRIRIFYLADPEPLGTNPPTITKTFHSQSGKLMNNASRISVLKLFNRTEKFFCNLTVNKLIFVKKI